MSKGRTTEHLIEVIGLEGAKRLVSAYRGQQLYIPSEPIPPYHPLAQRLGLEDAQRLQAEYRGRILLIPMGREWQRQKRNQAIIAARATGATVGELSQRFGLSRRRVYQILASGRGDKMRQNRC